MLHLSLPENRKSLLQRGFLLASILILIAVSCHPAVAARDVTVALTDLKTTLFTDEQGKPAGFFVDLIADMASKEDWNVIWVRGSLSESWNRLASGEIDLLPGVTRNPEREIVYDFSNESALSVWSQVYARPGSGISTILDLDGKKISAMKGAASGIGFRDYAQKFNVNVTFLEKETPDEIFAAVANGEADALVVYNTAGQESARTYGLANTPVMFDPTQFGFAVQKGRNQDLLVVVDKYLAEGKDSSSSVYNQAMQRWFGIRAGSIIPAWLFWGLIGVASLAALFVIMSLILRHEVRRKTAELARQNEELQYEVTRRRQAEEEMVRINEKLQTAYDQLTVKEGELQKNFQMLRKSEKALMQARKKLSLLNTLTFQDMQNAFYILAGYLQLSKVTGCSEKSQIHLASGEQVLQSVQSSLAFAEKYQNLGISQPRWHDIKIVLLNAISHLDFSRISRSVNMPDVEIFADPLLEDAFFALMETIVLQGDSVTRISLRCRKNTGSITILIESDGPGIPTAEKDAVFTWEHRGKGRSSLYLAREILSITEISLQETGEPGNGICFEITVPEGEYRISAAQE
jgi:ABC-type amino acid transport substrate-binding protein